MLANPVNVLSILQGTKVYRVPIFQRRYSWRLDEWSAFWDDLEYKRDEIEAGRSNRPHFLGNIVVQTIDDPDSTVVRQLVIDGQQRLVTILTLIAAIRDARRSSNPEWPREEYDNKFLTNPYDTDDLDRLVPTEFDQSDYIETIRNSNPQGGIGQAYVYFARKLKNRPDDELAAIASILLKRFLVILVETDEGDPVNTIFNTLNSKGRPLLPPDLIRNEILLHLDRSDSDSTYHKYWVPIERELVRKMASGRSDSSQFITFFWSREVPHSPNLSKKLLYQSFESRLRASIHGLNAKTRRGAVQKEVESIWQDFLTFRRIKEPNSSDADLLQVDEPLARELDHLNDWGSDTHVPVTMWVLGRVRDGIITTAEAAHVLRTLLSYLISRAILGIPTNNLNRLLSAIPASIQRAEATGNVSVSNALKAELSKPAYRWPTFSEARRAIVEFGVDDIGSSAQRALIAELAEVPSISPDREILASNLGTHLTWRTTTEDAIDFQAEHRNLAFEIIQSLAPGQYTTVENLADVMRVSRDEGIRTALQLEAPVLSLLRTSSGQVPTWIPEARRVEIQKHEASLNEDTLEQKSILAASDLRSLVSTSSERVSSDDPESAS